MDILQLLKDFGPALAAAGVLVAVTRYITQLQDRIESNNQLQETKNKISQLEQEATRQRTEHQLQANDLQNKLDRLTEKNQKLDEQYRLLLEGGASAATLKAQIDGELREIADRLGATAYSVLVPGPSSVPDEAAENLIFLCLVPDNPVLRNERISLDSFAGKVLAQPKTVITHDPAAAGAFSAQTDQVAHFKTANMLATPLYFKGQCVGVAEFLNKRNGLSFDPSDIDVAEESARLLGPKIGEFAGDLRNLKILGFTPKQRPTEATILVGDISNSSKLASSLDAAVFIDLMNQYMDALCDVGMQHGGTVEQLQGDGFIMTFNVRRSLSDHRSSAVNAAIQMQQRFRGLRDRWVTLRYPGTDSVFSRIGLTSGPVHKAELGPPQFRQITVMGDPVNAASHLCQYAPRDRDVILIGRPLFERLNPKPKAGEIQLAMAKREMADRAFEVLT